MRRVVWLVGLLAVCAWPSAVAAQEIPPVEPGVTTHVQLVDSIIVDGDLNDWAGIEQTITSTGPIPPLDPANTGNVAWSVAATNDALLFNARVPDATIVAGEHGENYWNEDSIELYINVSGNLAAGSYGPGIAQITFSPIDLGNNDPTQLTITGNNAETIEVSGFVVSTPDGWGVEASVSLRGLIEPMDGLVFGLQVHANGSSGGDRDTKLIWSLADTDDTSFQNPSVFGQGVFVDAQDSVETDSAEAVVDAASDTEQGSVPDTELVESDTTPELVLDQPETDPIGDDALAAPVITEDSDSTLALVLAVLAAVGVMFAGFWFERQRADRATVQQPALDAGPPVVPDSTFVVTEHEPQAEPHATEPPSDPAI